MKDSKDEQTGQRDPVVCPAELQAEQAVRTDRAERTEQTVREERSARQDGASACTAAAEDLGHTDAEMTLEKLTECAAEYAEILSAVPAVMDACIAEYKKRLACGRTGFAAPSGMAVMTAPARPKTLSDAKALADRLLSDRQ